MITSALQAMMFPVLSRLMVPGPIHYGPLYSYYSFMVPIPGPLQPHGSHSPPALWLYHSDPCQSHALMVPVLASLMVPYIVMIMVLGTLQPQDSESASPFHHGPIWSPLPSIIIPIAVWSLPPLQPHDLQSLQSPASWCPIPISLDMVPGSLYFQLHLFMVPGPGHFQPHGP